MGDDKAAQKTFGVMGWFTILNVAVFSWVHTYIKTFNHIL